MATALWAASAALHTPGDFVECGVNAGFISSAIMHHLDWASLPRTFHLVDSFDGPLLDQFSAEEVASGRRRITDEFPAQGAYVTDLKRIHANYAQWPNARIVQGAVPDVLG